VWRAHAARDPGIYARCRCDAQLLRSAGGTVALMALLPCWLLRGAAESVYTAYNDAQNNKSSTTALPMSAHALLLSQGATVEDGRWQEREVKFFGATTAKY
jgi:hypothetical protein